MGLLRLLLPGGNQVFKMKNVTFSGERQADGEAVIMAPQDCGLLKRKHNDGMATLCNVDFYFEDVDFSKVQNNGTWVGYNAVVGSPTAPVYISHDGSLADNRFLISSLYDGFKKVDGCSQSDDPRFEGLTPIEGAIACDKEEIKIGRLIIWTVNPPCAPSCNPSSYPYSSKGDIKLSGLGYDTEPNYNNITFTNLDINLKGLNAGYLNYGKKYKMAIVTFYRNDLSFRLLRSS